MKENNNTGSNAVWAIAMILIVAIIGGVLYYSGVLSRVNPAKQDINIKVDAPAAAPAPAAPAPAR